jgi:hypothetical protein
MNPRSPVCRWFRVLRCGFGRLLGYEKSNQDRGRMIKSYLRETNRILPVIPCVKVPDQRRGIRAVARKCRDVRQQNGDEAKLNLGEGLLPDKLASDFEMDTDLSEFLERCQLDFRSASLQSRFQDREGEIPGINIVRHPPVDDTRVRVTHDPRFALASFGGSEQAFVWSVFLFAHNS